MLNVSAVPILTITLRNNLMEIIPIRRWFANVKCCKVLLDDKRKISKGFWSIMISIPVLIIVNVTRNVQSLITYTGGICGTFILLIFPLTFVYFERKKDPERKWGVNPNKSPFQGPWYMVLVLLYALCTFSAVIYGLVAGSTGGH